MHKKKISLFVFIDAFGWELLQHHAFLNDLLPTKAPLNTVFGYSSTCDPTILTGKMPNEHGHFSCFYYNPQHSPFKPYRHLSLLPKSLTSRGRVRHWVSKSVKRFLGYSGYFQLYNMPFQHLPLFDYSEKRDIYQPGGINSGAPTIFDPLRQHNIPFHLSDWRKNEVENLASLSDELRLGNIEFAYLYMAEMDAILHAHGTQSEAVSQKIAWYDKQLRKIIHLAHQHYDTVHISLFSDHGMTDVTNVCNLMPQIDNLGFQFGKDYAAIFDSTMARFWFFSSKAQNAITDLLKQEPCGRILSEQDLIQYGCNFDEDQYGELFYLLKPGVLLCPSFMGETPLAGMHGYEPTHKDSVAMFASNSTINPLPNRLDDLYPLMFKEVFT